MAKNQNKNTDLLGIEWVLASGGKDLIDKCQIRVWECHLELKGFAALFNNMRGCEFTDEELYGIGLSLERLSKHLGKISEGISRSVKRTAE